ncbi:hypothetical protein HMPREF3293_00181, partial [Christensenella minuta]
RPCGRSCAGGIRATRRTVYRRILLILYFYAVINEEEKLNILLEKLNIQQCFVNMK